MRLIDADALIAKELEQKEYWMSRGHGDGGTNIVIMALELAPTVPAEIVVHCGECRHSSPCPTDENNLFCLQGKSGTGYKRVNKSHYCSYGKYRESEENR